MASRLIWIGRFDTVYCIYDVALLVDFWWQHGTIKILIVKQRDGYE